MLKSTFNSTHVHNKVNSIINDINSTLCSDSIESAPNNSKNELYQVDNSDVDDTTSLNQCPATISAAGTIGLLKSRKLLKVLLDSGSSACLIKRSALPQGIIPKELNSPEEIQYARRKTACAICSNTQRHKIA